MWIVSGVPLSVFIARQLQKPVSIVQVRKEAGLARNVARVEQLASLPEAAMACASCGSDNQGEFPAEIAIHLPDWNKPHVFIFPKLLICMHCGKSEFPADFAVPETELGLLAKHEAKLWPTRQ